MSAFVRQPAKSNRRHQAISSIMTSHDVVWPWLSRWRPLQCTLHCTVDSVIHYILRLKFTENPATFLYNKESTFANVFTAPHAVHNSVLFSFFYHLRQRFEKMLNTETTACTLNALLPLIIITAQHWHL